MKAEAQPDAEPGAESHPIARPRVLASLPSLSSTPRIPSMSSKASGAPSPELAALLEQAERSKLEPHDDEAELETDAQHAEAAQRAEAAPHARAALQPLQHDPVLMMHVREASEAFRIPPALLLAMIEVESSFNPDARSRTGAMGLMQLMPLTAKSLGVRDAFAPRENILGGARYLRELLDMFAGDLVLAVAAYNAGPTAVRRYKEVPPFPETQHYVRAVLKRYYAGSLDAAPLSPLARAGT